PRSRARCRAGRARWPAAAPTALDRAAPTSPRAPRMGSRHRGARAARVRERRRAARPEPERHAPELERLLPASLAAEPLDVERIHLGAHARLELLLQHLVALRVAFAAQRLDRDAVKAEQDARAKKVEALARELAGPLPDALARAVHQPAIALRRGRPDARPERCG